MGPSGGVIFADPPACRSTNCRCGVGEARTWGQRTDYNCANTRAQASGTLTHAHKFTSGSRAGGRADLRANNTPTRALPLSPNLPSTCPLGFKAGWGEEEGEGDGTTRGSIAAARPFGKIFCGGVGAPHRYIYKGMYRNLAHTAHTHLRTHPLTHTRRNCTISRTNSNYDDRVYL